MAAVTTTSERSLNRSPSRRADRHADLPGADLLDRLDGVQAAQPATTIPPTIVFTPEISPFVKLFTKRSQLRQPVNPEEYEAAPWWERWFSTAASGGARARAKCSGRVIPTAS
jgi:multiple sugar transport system permease protein